MKEFLRKFWVSKLNRVLVITGFLAVFFWALSFLWVFFQYGLMLCIAIMCFVLAVKFFKKKQNNGYQDFFPQSNNLKENLREEREENSQKFSRFFFGIIFVFLGILMIYKFIDFMV